MDFNLSEEQEVLRSGLRRFCEKEYAATQTAVFGRERLLDRKRWRRLGEDGWLAAVLSGEEARAPANVTAAALVMIELGRVLAAEPYCECAMMPLALLAEAAPSVLRERITSDVSSGNLIVAVACNHRDPLMESQPEEKLRCSAEGDVLRVSGLRRGIVGGSLADVLLVPLATEGPTASTRVFAVPRNRPGVVLHTYVLVDGSHLCELQMEGVAVSSDDELVYENAAQAVENAVQLGMIGLCSEAVGAMDAVVERTCEHLRTRRQFGVSLSSYQVLQHRLADMAIETELARSMLYCGLASLAERDAAARRTSIRAAKIQAGTSGALVGAQGLQLHGALGMSEEYPVGRFFKRLRVIDFLFGSAELHLSRLAAAYVGGVVGVA